LTGKLKKVEIQPFVCGSALEKAAEYLLAVLLCQSSIVTKWHMFAEAAYPI